MARLLSIDRKLPAPASRAPYVAETADALEGAYERGYGLDDVIAAYRLHAETLEEDGEARFIKRMPKFLNDPDGLSTWAGRLPQPEPEIPETAKCPDCGSPMGFDGSQSFYCTNPDCEHHGVFDGGGRLCLVDGDPVPYDKVLPADGPAPWERAS